ncbi:Putative S-adenosyl-L-methionine-dependent methyltransferase [Septoria linicola]|uniref:S-adenosyl-L-methionine-dependent methyltransferase n=1 Tax=Septoria linicola TaxID=215465 RepID=A0A9Q9AYY7_9PEZI|nr:putative S-adenosyl-L-methionine-dependent methyltransferase [Septoria linicola]USW55763.1 Putative S-adenosyl-L-methionine-dependent methyltransferase [Septoria linicola]
MDGPANHVVIAPAAQSAAESDVDSAYEGEIESETTSLTSSIAAHRYENGRRYNANKEEYWAPNDDDQNDQLDIAHHTFLLLMDGKLHMAPVGRNPSLVLDIGTGTGLWAIDFADENPESQVIATDISAVQPHWVPPNLRFEIDDCTEPWTFAEGQFEFIHVRSLYGSIADWPELYERIFTHLKPGGWFEQVEYSVCWRTDDDSIPPGHVFHEASRNYIEAGEKMGRTFRIWEMQKDLIDRAGFVDTVEQRFKMPLGPWAANKKLKEIGRWHLLEAYQDAGVPSAGPRRL